MARNYSLNLGEETIKGMTEKARAGIYPSCAPSCYRNVVGADDKRIIVPDEREAPVISKIFSLFASGNYSLKALSAPCKENQLHLRGKAPYVSVLHHVLRKRLYMGDFEWNGTHYKGTHEPLTSPDTWTQVQQILDGRKDHQSKSVRREFPFAGLLSCGHCGCSMVAELKKQKYVYYHCTGFRGKCPEPYTRQETLVAEFASVLSELVIPEEVLAWLADPVNGSDQTEAKARESAIKNRSADLQRLSHKLETLYEDRLEGRISKAFYDEKAVAIESQKRSTLARPGPTLRRNWARAMWQTERSASSGSRPS